MNMNHYENCGKCHGIHLGENCESSCIIGQPQIIGNFGISYADPKTGITPEYVKGVKFLFGSNTPDDIRKLGYSVAVHNDYKMHGIDCTFWLFTKLIDNQLIAFKGEGILDTIALDQIREQILQYNSKNNID